MNKLKFAKDEGTAFYKELNARVEQYFDEKGIPKTGNRKMFFKIILYFSLEATLEQRREVFIYVRRRHYPVILLLKLLL